MKEFLLALGGQMGVFLERLAADRALDSADAQFRLVAQAASVAVFTIDEQSNILFVNSAVERIFGYRPEELIGGKLTVVMPEYLRHVHEHALRRYVRTGQRHISWGCSSAGAAQEWNRNPVGSLKCISKHTDISRFIVRPELNFCS